MVKVSSCGPRLRIDACDVCTLMSGIGTRGQVGQSRVSRLMKLWPCQVELSAELGTPQHAVQLSSGLYVMTQHDAAAADQCVCVVDSQGHIRSHCTASRGFGVCRRDRRPAGIAISRRARCRPTRNRSSHSDVHTHAGRHRV